MGKWQSEGFVGFSEPHLEQVAKLILRDPVGLAFAGRGCRDPAILQQFVVDVLSLHDVRLWPEGWAVLRPPCLQQVPNTLIPRHRPTSPSFPPWMPSLHLATRRLSRLNRILRPVGQSGKRQP